MTKKNNNMTKKDLIYALRNVDDNAIIILDENANSKLVEVATTRKNTKQTVILRDYSS